MDGYSMAEAAKRIGVSYPTLQVALFHGYLAEPKEKFGNRRIFTDSDIDLARQYFNRPNKPKRNKK